MYVLTNCSNKLVYKAHQSDIYGFETASDQVIQMNWKDFESGNIINAVV